MNNKKNHTERIILTEKCNFNCKYCYQTNKRNLSIDSKVLEKRLNFLKQELDNQNIEFLFLSIFGGEPLTEKEKIKIILNYFKDYKNVKFQITTNGFLFDEEYFKIFEEVKNKIQITISLDGREKGNLPRCSEENTKKIISNIKFLINNNFDINLFTCINNINKNYLIEDLNFFIKDLNIPKIDLFFVGCGINGYNEYDLSFKQKKAFLRELYPFFEQNSEYINIENDYLISKFYGQINYKYYKDFSQRPLTYVWTMQPNGYAYSFYINTGVNIEDRFQFQVHDKSESLEKSYIHQLINYNLEEPKEIEIRDEADLIIKSYNKNYETRDYELNAVYFLVDESCNLDCKYCYEKTKFNNRMSLKQVEDYLKYIDDNYLCNTLILFGGEPTLNHEACIKILKEAPKEIYVSMSTNGIIFNEELMKAFFERERTWLQISLDGKYPTMKNRLGDNYNLFEKILENIEKYKYLTTRNDGNIINFHITLTNDNIKYLYDNIKFLLELNLTHKINITPDFKGNWSNLDLFLYENQIKLIMDYIEKEYKNKNKKIPYINLLSNSIPDYVDKQPDKPCLAGIDSFAINPKGDIYPCARLYTNFGERFWMGNVYNKEKLKNIFSEINMNKSNPNSCGKCNLSGCIRCYAANLEQTNNLDICNLNQCEMVKLNSKLNKIFKERFGENGEWK